MRGDAFHNHLVQETASALREAGFEVVAEHSVRLPDGRCDFVDLLATRHGKRLAVEIETTTRNVLVNAVRAQSAGLPLWIVVPTRKVRSAALKQLKRAGLRPSGGGIQVLLQVEVRQHLQECFPLFSTAYGPGENRKTERSRGSSAASGE
jgi:predicted RecB family endonuclease